MIFGKDDVATFISTQESPNGKELVTSKLEKIAGVFFNKISASNGDFLYFSIGVVDENSELKETKTFAAEDSKGFFEAVDYFEGLIQSRTPKEEKNPPSVGFFVLDKRKKLKAYVEGITSDKIEIDSDDIAKVFSPPKTKPFGRLNMFAVDNPKYDIIKQKYALKFDPEKSEDIAKDGVFAYRMTPYESNDSPPPEGGNPPPPPKGVNDDELSAKDIEDENPQDMKGNPKDDGPEDGPKEGPEDGPDGGQPKDGKPADQEGPGQQLQQKSQDEIEDTLNKALNVDDFISGFMRPEIVMNVVGGWSDKMLKDKLYEPFGVSKEVPTSQFKKELRKKIKPYFD